MKKILIIEDEYATRQTISDLLELEGFQVIAAENGGIGLELAQVHLPDLILCDVMMPVLDGYGVLKELRESAATATTPFIFLTSQVDRKKFRQGMELGADDYLTKPCTAKELVSAITGRLEKQSAVITQSQKQLDELRCSISLALPHELRTPLNGILGFAEVLMEDYERLDQPEILEIAQGIHHSAERLYRLTQNFLLYVELELTSRDRSRQELLQLGETHYPKALIANTATQIAQRLNRSTDLRLQLENGPVQIADLKLEKVVEEIIENAFKFSKTGSPVTITSRVQHNSLVLTIQDQGRGMTTDQIVQLGAYMQFERRFYEQQGSGLGFAIAKRLVELHEGELAVDSLLGQGTTVQITLPIPMNFRN